MKAIRIVLILWILTALIYPTTIFGVAQLPMFQTVANGSIRQSLDSHQPIGSSLIGQNFTSDKYFHGRPSTVRYSQGRIARPYGISGGSNLAPSNPNLFIRVMETASKLQDENIPLNSDLLYTSASGLDPHISERSARSQIERVARSRGWEPQELLPLIREYTTGKFLGIFGEAGVNVLRLNYALDLKDFDRQRRR
ncbi:K(+)-transporting ATPase subunit C [Calothrix sp. NIES-3974]|uniref:K(+)-transporting ATPase subunit C n=1 Tax=Calothrix sp. NIES-3974 TaxID=2005462 RepID=UPI000B617C01|nr:K(+)-transporting ATPase subunit C [Calothrix sp. NIES-3974]BAZ06429.1 K+ transporting ATPase, KdpC subunit [Calothrix sp. NIES-3974]